MRFRAFVGPRECVTLDVPGSPERPPFALEATFDRVQEHDEWDLQVLEASRYIAALVLEVERLALGPGWLGVRGETLHALVGSSDPIRELRDRISRVAATDFTVLVEGESGSGKELVARQLHEQSRRRRGPFVAVNCAALVETLLEAELFGIEERTATGVRGRRGKFEHADGGTLFLDEVSDLSLSAQAKLLRVLQDLAVERVGGAGPRRVDVRIVVATNRALSMLVQKASFRADLSHRLNGVEIHVPPLRHRRGDIPAGRALSVSLSRRAKAAYHADRDGCVAHLRMARQHSRVGTRHRARHCARERRRDWPG